MNLAGCDEIGYRQDGLITRRQSLEVLSKAQVRSLLESGAWNVVAPAVYRMTGVPDTWARRVRAATLSRPGKLIAAYRSAGYLLGIVERRPKTVDVLGAYPCSSIVPGIVVHRTRYWHEQIMGQVNSIPVTAPPRTIIDLTACASIQTVEKALDLAITRRLLKLEDIPQELARIGTQGRAHCTWIYKTLDAIDPRLVKADSPNEIDVFQWIQEAGLPLPDPQFRVVIDQFTTHKPDYAYPAKKLAIEVQSWKWHGGPVKQKADALKVLRMTALGWTIVPVIAHPDYKSQFLAALAVALRDFAA